MAELESEDSSDGVLIIDEPIEIVDDSNSDMESNDENIKNTSYSSLNPSCSTTKIGSTCKFCSRIFSTNNDLINHNRKFKGRNCANMTNVQLTTNTNITYKFTPKHSIRIKPKKPPKNATVIQPLVPVPHAIPLPTPLIPIFYSIKNDHTPTTPDPPASSTIDIRPLPSLSQMLIEEMDPEYPCTICGQIFRHNIGLHCHLNSEHKEKPTNEVVKVDKKDKVNKNKKIVKKNKDNKQIENNEPVSDTINLTLIPDDLKKDSLLNRMKSYVYSAAKDQVSCVLCNVNFTSAKRALAHVEDKHITKKIECGYCRMKFVYELKLRSHMAKRHKIIAVYKCDKCSKLIKKEESDLHSEKCKGITNQIKIKREKDDN